MEHNNVKIIVGRFLVLNEDGVDKNNQKTFTIKCAKCGAIKHRVPYFKINKLSCNRCSPSSKTCKKHLAKVTDWSSPRLAGIMHAMKQRCYNPNTKSYPNYGGRGITICDEWLENPQAFNDWAIDNGYSDDLTIDRIDNYDGYKPDNCRWITRSENSSNTRRTNHVTVNGITHTLPQWCAIIGIHKQRLYSTLRLKGIDEVEKMISDYLNEGIKPRSAKKKFITVNGETLSGPGWCKKLGIKNKKYLIAYRDLHGTLATIKRIKEIMANPESYKPEVHKQRPLKVHGLTKLVGQWATELGLDKNTVYSTYRKGEDKAIKLIENEIENSGSNGPLIVGFGNNVFDIL